MKSALKKLSHVEKLYKKASKHNDELRKERDHFKKKAHKYKKSAKSYKEKQWGRGPMRSFGVQAGESTLPAPTQSNHEGKN